MLAVAAAGAGGAARAAPPTAAQRAADLHRAAVSRLALDDLDLRRAAMAQLEEAVALDPRPEYLLALGRAQESAGHFQSAITTFTRAARAAPRDPEPARHLAQLWKREWLHYLEPAHRDSAIAAWERVVALRPYALDAWLALVPLRCEAGHLDAAAAAAERAQRVAPRRGEGRLAGAYVAFRQGFVERADSAFRAAWRGLDPQALEFLHDFTPLADPSEAGRLAELPATAREREIERYWAALDPDPTTVENEARLEFWARGAHAWFLFREPGRRDLDYRAEVYKRYGAPARATLNPLDESLEHRYHDYARPTPNVWGPVHAHYMKGISIFPMNALVWEYPEAGMRVLMHDRSLTRRWDPAVRLEHDPREEPDTLMLQRNGEWLAAGAGRALFRAKPPRERRIELDGVVARFEGDRGPRLFAQIDAPGSPADHSTAHWVVRDTAGREVARGEGALETSACDPTARRRATLAVDVAPGDYEVAWSVRRPDGHRGVHRARARVAPPRALGLSDLVVSCGSALRAGTLGVEADPRARVGSTLVGYFEAYRLAAGPDGLARFEYEVRVRPREDTRGWFRRTFGTKTPSAVLQASREETHLGSIRRQFVSVPVQSLRPGRYRLEIRVRDLVSNHENVAFADFVRDAPTAIGVEP